MNKIGHQVLGVAMEQNDSGATTVRGYLAALVGAVWREGDGFSGKCPFGNSGWDDDLYRSLAKAGLIEAAFHEDGYLEDADWGKGRELIDEAIAALAEQDGEVSR